MVEEVKSSMLNYLKSSNQIEDESIIEQVDLSEDGSIIELSSRK
jgi:hypothetical protein